MTNARVDMYIYLTWACRVSRTYSRESQSTVVMSEMRDSYLQLNLSLSNILLAAAAVGNLLGLGDLVADSL